MENLTNRTASDADPPSRLVPPDVNAEPLAALRAIVAMLRGPGGCPWDREQTHRSLRSVVIEEAYEVAAAIDHEDPANLREELGDLLLQVIFHAQLASENLRFGFDDVARGIAEKLIRRHPHVFGNDRCADAHAVLERWDDIKRGEKSPSTTTPPSLDEGARGLPALLHAEKVQKAAARLGFDWPELTPVIAKVREELAEVEAVVRVRAEHADDDDRRLEDELGDLFFAVVNVARTLGIDAEVALARATRKFITRFEAMRTLAADRNHSFSELTLAQMDALWEEVKAAALRRDS